MGRPLILGSEPEKDPLDYRSKRKVSISTDAEIDWDDRTLEKRYSVPIVFGLFILLCVLANPLFMLVISMSILSITYILTKVPDSHEIETIKNSQWVLLKPRKDFLTETVDSVLYVDNDESRHLVALKIDSPSNLLFGSLGGLIRALDTEHGFSLCISMHTVSIEHVLNQDRIHSTKEEFLESIGTSGRSQFISIRGGLWTAKVSLVGHLKQLDDVITFESAVHGGVPTSGWCRLDDHELFTLLAFNTVLSYPSGFYALGHELSEWLVQLPSELAPEVGSNVPSEFLSPIKTTNPDYSLGVAINPETLQTGPEVGFTHTDLINGTLVCGGTESERKRILALLIQELLKSDKRVLFVTSNRSNKDLAGIQEDSISLDLGGDFVLNPVDPDLVPRTEYVGQLISALEILAGENLSGAADLEIALNRVVALGNTTVADIRFDTAEELMENPSFEQTSQTSSPSRKSLAGLDAIRLLHEGSGASAFYGTQTIPMQRLTQIPFTVISVNLGSVELNTFACDLLMMKLAGLEHDSDFVIIFDEPLNLVARNHRHHYRIPWMDFIAKRMKKRGPFVIAMEHPADFSPTTIGLLTSCVSARLRESADVKVSIDLLGLSVIQTGMHSKARHSSRETSFLRVIPDGVAVLANTGGELGYPVKLDDMPEIVYEFSKVNLSERLPDLSIAHESSHDSSSLIEHVMGRDIKHGVSVLRLLQRYEPLTLESIKKFISTTTETALDIESILLRLEQGSMILKGHEVHSGVSYMNYRLTMKGIMALRQYDGEGSSI
ncbi:MAG: hypothetical protein GF411_12255 [Candidatus Lokiarchaeota archaeon]|nr:hypothetical protein [Candidatus Lokiarchaeota archaeon]